MNSPLNEVDLAFVIDTTGSMGPFIKAAQSQMRAILEALARDPALSLDLRVAIVEYRDHPPQENTFTAQMHPFSHQMEQVEAVIDGLVANGGGDTPESVYDGLMMACDGLTWRVHSRRIIILIGDAPPHNQRRQANAPQPLFGDCTCGLTLDQVSAAIECAGAAFYAIDLSGGAMRGFQAIAAMTGGKYVESQNPAQVITLLEEVLRKDFGELELDRKVLNQWNSAGGDSAGGERAGTRSIEHISQALSVGEARVGRSLERLARRKLLTLAE
jgi:hypothetical protein